MRSTPIEWDLFGNGGPWDYGVNGPAIYQYWLNGTERAKPYESLYTMGMRGTRSTSVPSDDTHNIICQARAIVRVL